jgi:hypothetical protein
MSTQTELALKEAKKTGVLAAQACADAAERRNPGWVQKAYDAFVAYARFNGPSRQFTTEDVRNGVAGVPEAPDARAWGSIAMRCKREGIVVSVGYKAVESSNGSPKTLWQLNPQAK